MPNDPVYIRVSQRDGYLHYGSSHFDSFQDAEEYLEESGGGYITIATEAYAITTPSSFQKTPIQDVNAEEIISGDIATYFVPASIRDPYSIADAIEIWVIDGDENKAIDRLARRGNQAKNLSEFIYQQLLDKNVPIDRGRFDERKALTILAIDYPRYAIALHDYYLAGE